MATSNLTAILCRVSTEAQADDDATSLKTQEINCRNAAAELNLTVDEDHVVKCVESASEPYHHPQLEWLFAEAARGKFNHLIMDVIDRTTRGGIADFHDITSRFLSAGVALHWASDRNIDLSTEDGQLMASIAAWKAYQDKATIVRRFTNGKEGRLREGKPGRAWINYGYRWVEEIDPATGERKRDKHGHLIHERQEPDPIPAQIVQRIFRWLAQGGSATALVTQLNAEHIPTPSAYKGRSYKSHDGAAPTTWGVRTILVIVRNPIYIGKREQKKYAVRKRTPEERRAYKERTGRDYTRNRKVETRETPLYVFDDVVTEPLVDELTFHKASQQLRANDKFGTRGAIRYTPEDVLLGGGYVRCAYCGYAMTPNRHSAKRGKPATVWQYVCTRQPHLGKGTPERPRCPGASVPARRLDAFVWQQARRLIRDREYLRAVVAETDDAWSPDTQIAHYTALIADVTRREKALTRQVEEMDLSDPDLGDFRASLLARAKELKHERAQHEQQLATATAERDRRHAQHDRLRDFATWADAHRDDLDTLTPTEQQARVLALHPVVYVARPHDPDRPRVDLLFSVTNDPRVRWPERDERWQPQTWTLRDGQGNDLVVGWMTYDPTWPQRTPGSNVIDFSQVPDDLGDDDAADDLAAPPLAAPATPQIVDSTLRSPGR